MTDHPSPSYASPAAGGSPAPPDPPARSASWAGVPMAVRHVVSVVTAMVLAPVGLLVLDYGSGRYHRERLVHLEDTQSSTALLVMVAGIVLLALTAACTRISGLGPVVAGVVWGVVPFLWFFSDAEGFFEAVQDLPTDHFWFASPTYLFPLAAAFLLGAGAGGRWARRRG